MTLPIKELRAKAEADEADAALYFAMLEAAFKYGVHEEFAKWEAETRTKTEELEQLK